MKNVDHTKAMRILYPPRDYWIDWDTSYLMISGTPEEKWGEFGHRYKTKEPVSWMRQRRQEAKKMMEACNDARWKAASWKRPILAWDHECKIWVPVTSTYNDEYWRCHICGSWYEGSYFKHFMLMPPAPA